MEPVEANEFEQAARAVKAYKLARCAARVLLQFDLSIVYLEQATKAERERLAVLAKVKPPSDATWAVTVELTRTLLRERGRVQ